MKKEVRLTNWFNRLLDIEWPCTIIEIEEHKKNFIFTLYKVNWKIHKIFWKLYKYSNDKEEISILNGNLLPIILQVRKENILINLAKKYD